MTWIQICLYLLAGWTIADLVHDLGKITGDTLSPGAKLVTMLLWPIYAILFMFQ